MKQENMGEKVSVNINSSTLSSIDLLVDNGYYSNRSDFINQALRDCLQSHSNTIDRIVERNTSHGKKENGWFLGICGIERSYLEELYSNDQTYSITGYGVLVIDKDCPEDLLFSVVTSIKVKGKVRCSDAVKQHYGLK